MRISDWSSDVCSSDLSPAKHEEAACEDRSCSSASSLLLLPINVHEMFYTSLHAISRFSAVSQIEHQAWVACCVTAETGGSHPGLAEEFFNGSPSVHALSPYQIGRASCRERVCQ